MTLRFSDVQVTWYGALLPAFLTALQVGGGAIAEDARSGAFQFYFARPITRVRACRALPAIRIRWPSTPS